MRIEVARHLTKWNKINMSKIQKKRKCQIRIRTLRTQSKNKDVRKLRCQHAYVPSIFCVRVLWKTVVVSKITTDTNDQAVYDQYSSNSHNNAQKTWNIAKGDNNCTWSNSKKDGVWTAKWFFPHFSSIFWISESVCRPPADVYCVSSSETGQAQRENTPFGKSLELEPNFKILRIETQHLNWK